MNTYLDMPPPHAMLHEADNHTIGRTDDWKVAAAEAYHRRQANDDTVLRAELIDRVQALTGRLPRHDRIVVDPAGRIAVSVTDDVRFRWARSTLVMLRPCEYCGTGEFASQPLSSSADVGYALTTWQPLHVDCQPYDPAN